MGSMPMELLAPAGGMEQLRAAVAFGADAVYLAAERFGMRARAANFRMDEIPAAVAFAHEHGVKVHVTCNILMHPDDIDELPAFFRALDAAGVDAFIIGDPVSYTHLHASADLIGKVKGIPMEKTKKRTTALKFATATCAALLGVFVVTNGVCYAATGETWVEKATVYINGEPVELDVQMLSLIHISADYSGTSCYTS